MNLNQLFEILPDIIVYISAGYLFISVFCFLSLKKKKEDVNSIFCASLSIGFILKSILCCIKIRFSYYINIIGLLIFSVLLAFLFGYFINGKRCRKFLQKLSITRSTNKNIWHDIIDIDKKPMWIKATNTEKQVIITGLLVMVEEFERFPQLLLQRYIVFDLDKNIKDDFHEYDNYQILLKTEDFDKIEIIYDTTSTQYKKIEIEGENND